MQEYQKIIEKLKSMPADMITKLDIPTGYIDDLDKDTSKEKPAYISQWTKYWDVKYSIYLLFLSLAQDMGIYDEIDILKLSEELEHPRGWKG